MIAFDAKYFKKIKFSKEQVLGYLTNAMRDLEIAEKDRISEVRFTFAYQALVKAGIACLAHAGYKLRTAPGHHVRLIEKLSELLKDPNVFTFGNAMRMKRNEDLYGDSGFVSEQEAEEYLEFVRSTLGKVKVKIKRNRGDLTI